MGFVQICHVCQRKVELIQFQDLFITQTVQCSLHVSVSNATSEFPDDEFLLKTRPLKLFCAILCYFAHWCLVTLNLHQKRQHLWRTLYYTLALDKPTVLIRWQITLLKNVTTLTALRALMTLKELWALKNLRTLRAEMGIKESKGIMGRNDIKVSKGST